MIVFLPLCIVDIGVNRCYICVCYGNHKPMLLPVAFSELLLSRVTVGVEPCAPSDAKSDRRPGWWTHSLASL